MTIQIKRKTEHYNPQKYNKPWIAKVDFSKSPKGDYAWGSWIGDSSVGSDGVLVLEGLENGDIVAIGQKAAGENQNSIIEYYQVTGGELMLLSGKTEAYELGEKHRHEVSDKYGQVYGYDRLTKISPADRNRYLKALKGSGLMDQLTVEQNTRIVVLMHEMYFAGKG